MLVKLQQLQKIDFILQSRTLTGQFTMYMTAGFVCGLIMAFPFLFFQIWKFLDLLRTPRLQYNPTDLINN